jgi:hypothetical protein
MPPFVNPFTNPNASGGFRPQLKVAARLKCFVIVNPTRAGEARVEHPVPTGTNFIWDTLWIETGFARPVKGRYAETLVPLGFPDPPLPPNSDPAEWVPMTKSQVWLDGFEGHPAALRVLSLTGIIAMNAMAGLLKQLSFRQEIQRGQLPVLRIAGFEDVETVNGIFGAPILELIGFVKRNEDTFGPPLIAPPAPMLCASHAAPQIPSPSNDGSTPSTASAPSVPQVPPPAASAPVVPQVPDPLARFRPAPAGPAAGRSDRRRSKEGARRDWSPTRKVEEISVMRRFFNPFRLLEQRFLGFADQISRLLGGNGEANPEG